MCLAYLLTIPRGDVRMTFAEDKRKVRNIAKGVFALSYATKLLHDYAPDVLVKKTDSNLWAQENSPSARLCRLIQLPFRIQCKWK